MKKLLILAVLILIPVTVTVHAQTPTPPVSLITGPDLSNGGMLIFVGLNISVKQNRGTDSTLTSQVYTTLGYLHEELDGGEKQGIGGVIARDAQLWKKLRFALTAGWFKFPVQNGPDLDWQTVGGEVSFCPNKELKLRLGGSHVWKDMGERNGATVYFGASIRPRL